MLTLAALTQLFRVSTDAIHRTANIVRHGGLVLYPTDTVYGLGCNPFDESAVAKLAMVKQRSKDNFPVLVASMEEARLLGSFEGRLEASLQHFWPGPLTVVVPCKLALPKQVIGEDNMVGVRIPQREDTLELISRSGGFLVGTSANISGMPSLRNIEEAMRVFDGKVDVILDGGPLTTSLESTVVKQTRHGVQLLREGAIKFSEFEASLKSM